MPRETDGDGLGVPPFGGCATRFPSPALKDRPRFIDQPVVCDPVPPLGEMVTLKGVDSGRARGSVLYTGMMHDDALDPPMPDPAEALAARGRRCAPLLAGNVVHTHRLVCPVTAFC